MNIITKLIETHIFRRNNGIEFLLLKRSGKEIYPNTWQQVTGKIKSGEKASATALREVKEETSLQVNKMWVVPNVNSYYDPQQDFISLIPVFVVEVVNGEEVALSDEHADYKWCSFEEAGVLLAWPGQRRSLEIINEYLTNDKSTLMFNEISL